MRVKQSPLVSGLIDKQINKQKKRSPTLCTRMKEWCFEDLFFQIESWT